MADYFNYLVIYRWCGRDRSIERLLNVEANLNRPSALSFGHWLNTTNDSRFARITVMYIRAIDYMTPYLFTIYVTKMW